MNKKSPWFINLNKSKSAVVRVFAFHHAGSSASFCRDWVKYIGPEFEVVSVQLPGREQRFSEKPFTNMFFLVKALVSEIRPYLDMPYVFFGHSMGALIAFELINEIVSNKLPCPFLFFPSGRQAPHIPDKELPKTHLADDEFCKRFVEENNNPVIAEILGSADLRALFLPQLRADIELIETYEYSKKPPVPASVVVLNGKDDVDIEPELIPQWAEYFQGEFEALYLPGDHFYVHSAVPQLVAQIQKQSLQRFIK